MHSEHYDWQLSETLYTYEIQRFMTQLKETLKNANKVTVAVQLYDLDS